MYSNAIEASATDPAKPALRASELVEVGTIMLPPFQLFSRNELADIEQLCASVPKEVITLGDAGEPNDLYVGRFLVDKAGERPTRVNRPHSDRLLEILQSPERRTFFGNLLGGDHVIRRCQVNRMVTGSFIGHHLDVDSNPDYEVSVVIQLGLSFGGGEFVVYPEGRPANPFHPTYGTVIVSKCVHPHEVRQVTAGTRTSLVYFYSRHACENRRPREGSE